MKDILSPSIMCGDLLNLEAEIRKLEEAKVDLIHFDIMDTTFTDTTMLPPKIIPMIMNITDIPLDIHVMISQPERIISTFLPYCKGNYVSFHIEVTKEMGSLVQQVKKAGGKAGVALNSATPVYVLEELIPHIDMVLLILGNAGTGPRQMLDDQLLNKIAKVRKMLDDMNKQDIILEVDGGVSFEVARRTKERGANAFVLGTSSIYQPGKSVVELCNSLREYLK